MVACVHNMDSAMPSFDIDNILAIRIAIHTFQMVLLHVLLVSDTVLKLFVAREDLQQRSVLAKKDRCKQRPPPTLCDEFVGVESFTRPFS